jgi:hypothetical protein
MKINRTPQIGESFANAFAVFRSGCVLQQDVNYVPKHSEFFLQRIEKAIEN